MRIRHFLAASAAFVSLVGGGLAVAEPAAAGTAVCEKFGSVKIQSSAYIVQNNVWGTSSTQCIDVGDKGFSITRQDGVNPQNGAPTAYPSVYWGCHYNNCTANSTAIQANSSAFAGVSTKVAMSYPSSGAYNASYDIWFDPTARKDGENTGAEIMVWLKKTGTVQPYGAKVATATIAGTTWDVWRGVAGSGANVVSYVRTTAASSADFKVKDFYSDAVSRGYAQNSWYLTSIQAGFEPWSGAAGLAVTDFAVTGTGQPVGPGPTTGCKVTYQVTDSWNTGFIGNVTVTNTGTAPTKAWKTGWTWPGEQKLVNQWNVALTTTGKKVDGTNLSYNGVIPVGGSTTYGMQVDGSAATPAVSCTAS